MHLSFSLLESGCNLCQSFIPHWLWGSPGDEDSCRTASCSLTYPPSSPAAAGASAMSLCSFTFLMMAEGTFSNALSPVDNQMWVRLMGYINIGTLGAVVVCLSYQSCASQAGLHSARPISCPTGSQKAVHDHHEKNQEWHWCWDKWMTFFMFWYCKRFIMFSGGD